MIWYANHPTVGEIHIESDSKVSAILGRRFTLFSPRMAWERLSRNKDQATRECYAIELSLGNLGIIPDEIRQECTIEVKLDDFHSALFLALTSFPQPEGKDELLELMDKRFEDHIVKLWNEKLT